MKEHSQTHCARGGSRNLRKINVTCSIDPKVDAIPFISLFMITPVSGTIIREPKKRLTVVVSDRARPDESAVTICEVP